MANRGSHVPKFGDWHANDEVPYTMVFDSARAGKGTGPGNKPINPNNPMENPGAFGLSPSLDEVRAGGPTHPAPRRTPNYGRELADNNGPYQSPSHPANRGRVGAVGGRPVGVQPPAHDPRDSRERRPSSENVSAYASPIHAKGRPRTGAGAGSGAGAGPREEKLGPTLPKFGEWDEKDPAAGEGYTMIFTSARDERKGGGPVRIPQLSTPQRQDPLNNRSPYHSASSQEPKKCGGCSIL